MIPTNKLRSPIVFGEMKPHRGNWGQPENVPEELSAFDRNRDTRHSQTV